MMWEKNGQVKIFMADAVFPGSTSQRKVFESVQGAFGATLLLSLSSLFELCT